MVDARDTDTHLERAEAVKAEAARLGFDACGIARAGAIDPEDRFGAWLAKGYHADMEWLARSKDVRQDVQKKIEGTKSVVVVARNYYAPRPAMAAGSGRVSRYAWGRDYHRVLRRPLRELASFIATLESGATCYASIDSGPVMERAWAARAGVGWIGKHGLILRRDLGSWIFLATILTTLEMAADSPVPDGCSDCTRCIEACPTGAITEAGVVDSRLCIAYHTVENRGVIPKELRPLMGDWVFGCDQCQEACPYNRFPLPTSESAFHPLPGHANLDLAELQLMTEEAFNSAFEGTPIRRAKWAGLLRNAAVVITRKDAQ